MTFGLPPYEPGQSQPQPSNAAPGTGDKPGPPANPVPRMTFGKPSDQGWSPATSPQQSNAADADLGGEGGEDSEVLLGRLARKLAIADTERLRTAAAQLTGFALQTSGWSLLDDIYVTERMPAGIDANEADRLRGRCLVALVEHPELRGELDAIL